MMNVELNEMGLLEKAILLAFASLKKMLFKNKQTKLYYRVYEKGKMQSKPKVYKFWLPRYRLPVFAGLLVGCSCPKTVFISFLHSSSNIVKLIAFID